MKPGLDDRWSAESFEDYSIRTSEVWEKEGEEFRINTRWGGGGLFFCKKPVIDGDLINEFRETGSLPPPTADVTEEMLGSGITDLTFYERVEETQKPLLLNAVLNRGRQGGDASKKSDSYYGRQLSMLGWSLKDYNVYIVGDVADFPPGTCSYSFGRISTAKQSRLP